MDILILTQFMICLILCGLVWTIQLVHYPAFYFVSQTTFKYFSTFHSNKITYFVAPLMLLETITGTLILYFVPSILTLINLIGILITVLVTFFISIPLHDKLAVKKFYPEIEKLIYTNWIRTFLWTTRSFLLMTMVLELTGN
jgi:hypothetical protein